MKRTLPCLLLLVCVFSLLAAGACSSGKSPAEAELWTCPMHPTYLSDHPGTCPICNMDLVKKEKAAPQATAAAEGERRVLFYRSPMDPAVTSPTPAKDGMGMDFVPVYADGSGATPGGAAGIDSDPETMRRAGVVTEIATVGRLERSVRAAGTVVADERRLVRAQAKISGWVERLDVNATGLYVKEGAPAMAIYSPELLTAQNDYLLARDAANRFAGSQLPEVRRGGQDLLVGARRRLELLDVPESFIVELDRTRTAQRTVNLLVPASGFVTAKSVVQGQEITPGMELYTVTDLSSVWVEAAFFESEARWISIGKPATIRLPYDDRRSLTAKIAYVYPTVDAAARTLTARFELPNPGFALRPGMFVDVELGIDLGEGVLVPASAVIDSGLKKTVFVETAPGRLEPREVETGERSGGSIQIVRGVAAGERVATRANFLLDAESRIRGAVAATQATPAAGTPAPDPHEDHR